MENEQHSEQHLAWHETLEIHELVAFQSVGLMKLKKAYQNITDPTLQQLYTNAINGLTKNLEELIAFYPMAPGYRADENRKGDIPFYAGDLLALFKTGIRNYAIAITETATPALRNVLKKHLNNVIDIHAEVYTYMYRTGYYPSYDLKALLANDLTLAQNAIEK
ncbi:spore coat protein F [Halobacillus dabanensis]|uniref:Spore coat protein F n=1 Tax=Halobacillus dabanensis TaxID=240302 RepID=A0A1I3Q6Z0_HALDA|nr:spore coat protein [Halobacillus dabanensis]SFJ29648.1 spore coat protein F [Halobacillus dabanensis]